MDRGVNIILCHWRFGDRGVIGTEAQMQPLPSPWEDSIWACDVSNCKRPPLQRYLAHTVAVSGGDQSCKEHKARRYRQGEEEACYFIKGPKGSGS